MAFDMYYRVYRPIQIETAQKQNAPEPKMHKVSEQAHNKYDSVYHADMIFKCKQGKLYFNKQTAYQYARFATQINESKDEVVIVKCEFTTNVMRFILRHMDGQAIDPTNICTADLAELWLAADYYQLFGLVYDTLAILNGRTFEEGDLTYKFVTVFMQDQYWNNKEIENIRKRIQNSRETDLVDYPIEFAIRHNDPRRIIMQWAKCNAEIGDELFNRSIETFRRDHSELTDICEFIHIVYNHEQYHAGVSITPGKDGLMYCDIRRNKSVCWHDSVYGGYW